MGVVLMILGFVWWWPIGLLILGFMIARRRRYGYGCAPQYNGQTPMMGAPPHMDRWERKMARAEQKVERARAKFERFVGGRGDWFAHSSSGNAAFDDYRTQTLNRLEQEQHEFKDFLERLRFAKDRSEFDQFMAERRQRPLEPEAPETPPAPPSH